MAKKRVSNRFCILPVSYTHLDVYKRQVQVILYVGGIMVLFIFVIMLVNLDVSLLQYQFNRQRFVAGALALALGAQIFLAIKMGQKSLFPQASVPEILPKNTDCLLYTSRCV